MKINKSLVREEDGGATYGVPNRDASYDCRHCFQLGNGRTMPPPPTINTYIHVKQCYHPSAATVRYRISYTRVDIRARRVQFASYERCIDTTT
ncbi:unnamed protein product [Macrosiphum euphorbiae]|uniref:Uncharacterized protein n=1 Tax=Macrosiphum euphorbiae TaxID=13131 RepID=A0AAV0XC80_9HEMI|nr:unnamed protein product [Macrosiphum euphorbiae]